ncbi:hypothetical protein FOA43_001303 [Brettanomyces nanus]|uniref:Glucosidase 2 subunit beta n=1 Tax=Eeniella nana TaxID=13502 RepID=A0A875RY02_EENNA|nr:uncharacterized protein FOA43_001303 [Brettanomyces nanus]QPG73986.1 hypothetical protein FOA43_001303 [Brettanomyces nanus]
MASLVGSTAVLKGVAPKNYPLYVPDKDGNFHCLNDSTIVISFDRVNDDYCDCPDGSDEPGTSACSNGKFYCANEGFKPHYIPSSWVNDGVCDYQSCCDGSDETEGVCANRCKELQEEFELRDREMEETVVRGLELRQKIAEKSRQQRLTLQNEVKVMDKQIEQLECSLKQLKADKELAGSEGEKQVELTFQKYGEMLNEASSKAEAQFMALDEHRKRIEALEAILGKMNDDYNHNFNDPAVKLAAQSYQEYVASRADMKDEDKNDEMKAIFGDLEGLFVTAKAQIAEKLSMSGDESPKKSWPSAKDLVDAFLGVRRNDEIQNDVGRSLIEIETAIEDTEKRMKDAQRQVNEKKADLEKSYGPEDLLRSKTDCTTNKIAGYNYKGEKDAGTGQ